MTMDAPHAPPSRAGSLPLAGGVLCLDFTNTASGRGTDHHIEHLRCFDHLLAWAGHVGLADQEQRQRLQAAAARLPRRAQQVVEQAHRLREAIYDLFRAAIAVGEPPARALAELNLTLARGMAAAVIAPTSDGFVWDWPDRGTTPEGLLWPIARSAAELLTGPRLGRVKPCPGHNCGWLFLDQTRNGGRRWCEMEVCGSRAKMRRYHQRRRRIAPAASAF
jgi:predicted RNA-binding Zn ribbon-like protein